LAAVTIRVDEFPEVIVPGFAEMVTVGAAAAPPVEAFVNVAPQPVSNRDKQRKENADAARPAPERNRGTVRSNKAFSFQASALEVTLEGWALAIAVTI
jgi:hypothetical protein